MDTICRNPRRKCVQTARVFVAEIIVLFGRVDFLLSDKGSGFISAFFATISNILGVKHKTSASLATRTNGLAERQIRALNQGLKLYCGPDEDDRHLEKYLPLIELWLRASANSDSKLSPFFILHGYQMPLSIKSDVEVPDTFHSREAQQYASWLKNANYALHDTVKLSVIESKQKMKAKYDRRHRAKSPDFEVGQLVLMKDSRIPPGSNKVLTKRSYGSHPYIIKQVVKSHGAGPAYKLTDPNTAKDLRGLIAYDRLKHFKISETSAENMTAPSASVTARPCYQLADRILQDSIIGGEERFLIQF